MSDDFGAWLQSATTEATERSHMARKIHDALKAAGKRDDHRVLSYRCARRCLLLDVFEVPGGMLIAQPRYKVSATMNQATSSAAGRERHTEDGDRRWQEQAFFAVDAAGFSLTCDHIASYHLSKDTFDRDIAAGGSEIIIRPT